MLQSSLVWADAKGRRIVWGKRARALILLRNRETTPRMACQARGQTTPFLYVGSTLRSFVPWDREPTPRMASQDRGQTTPSIYVGSTLRS